MPRRRMMDYGMMMRDGRNPYGAEGGYITSGRRGRRGGRRDRAMGQDYADYDMDMARGRGRGGDRAGSDYGDMARGDRAGRDYGDYEDMARGGRGRDRAGDYGDYESDMARGRGGRDGHYGQGYMPIEAMGYFTGYYGMGEEDYARGGRGRGRDRGMGDYGMDYADYARGGRRDYGYDYAGDYGENLTKEELEHWKKKLMKEVDEKDKQFFETSNIEQKAKQMGIEMKEFNKEELAVTVAMVYTDYCKTLGTSNMDLYIRLAKDWLLDPDSAVKGGEKLALYFDIVSGEEE